MPREPEDDETSSTTIAGSGVGNEFEGTNAGNLIQTGNVHGDVNFYSSSEPSAARQEVPLVATVSIDKSSPQVYMKPRGNPPWSFHVSGETYVRVLVEAYNSQAVILQAIRPIILSQQEPRPTDPDLRGLSVGVLAQRLFDANLDSVPPRLESQADGIDFPLTVTANDPELFVIRPRSEYETLWKLELDWTVLGRAGTLTIDDNGAPFRLHPGYRSDSSVIYQA